MATYYETPEVTIGKHQWRCVVKDGRWGIVTEYQFRLIPPPGQPAPTWTDGREWPTYNINDGMYLGMPKSLTSLYEQYKEQIKAALNGQPIPEPAQASLLV